MSYRSSQQSPLGTTLGAFVLVAVLVSFYFFVAFIYDTVLPWLHTFELAREGVLLALLLATPCFAVCALLSLMSLARRAAVGAELWFLALVFGIVVGIGLRFEHLNSLQ